MVTTPTYSFNMTDHRRSIRGIAAMMAGFIIIMFTGLKTNLNINWLIGIVLTWFLITLFLLIRWIWRQENVTLYADRLSSDLYGEIYYEDIVRISSPWYADTYSIKLQRKGKRSVTWSMVTSGRALIKNSDEEIKLFTTFTNELLKKSKYQPENKAAGTSTHSVIQTAGQQEKTFPFRKPSFVVPVGILLTLVILIRTCGGNWFRRNDMSRLKEAGVQLFNYNMEAVQKAVAERLKTEGSAFLYTNDHAATIKLFPDIDTDNPLNIDPFRYTEANRSMEEFLAHKDSIPLHIFIISGDSSISRMQPGIAGYPDSTEKQFFLRAYDTSQHIRPAGRPLNDTADLQKYPVFDVRWGVNVKDTSNLAIAIDRSIPGMHIMLSQIRLRRHFYCYMTGKASNGFGKERFTLAIYALNQLLCKCKVDTTTFVMRQYN
ncbi:MAG TPA: hypothetical protein VM802_07170 [Chitinophaga sp.]|uniref:hypothetical protein n=1 Tax=Chitinophaga sp. TaxID=1869181 RepID=UPI002C18E611|nr:hypothetical protein [Chitinophaga sp.]HVI44631.1 hypothetical protein [Chitinophaga sp.]